MLSDLVRPNPDGLRPKHGAKMGGQVVDFGKIQGRFGRPKTSGRRRPNYMLGALS